MTATLSRPNSPRASALHAASNAPFSMPVLDDLQAELAALSAANEELLASHGLVASPAVPPEAIGATGDEIDEMVDLRAENAALRARITELENQLSAASSDAQRRREEEARIEEQNEIIRGLHEKIKEMKEGKSNSSGEVEHAFRELEEDRRRLQEDEEGLQNQLREMETTLARERAELGRQRADVQRLQVDLQREIDTAARDPQLRERLQNLQRRPGSRVELPRPTEADQSRPKTPVPTPTKKTGSGLFRRLFGGAQA